MSALARKSLTDLTRRKARASFAVVALAIAVASIGIFAMPALSDQMMQKEIRSSNLADLVVDAPPFVLGPSQMAVEETSSNYAVQFASVTCGGLKSSTPCS